MKKKSFSYHIFLFLSTFTRSLVEVFSLVLLYQRGFSVQELFFFLFLMYFVGIFVNYISLKLPYKVVLVGSSLLYGSSFLYLSFMKNTYFSLLFLAILLASSNYSYHVIRHYLACTLLEKDKDNTNKIVMVMYLGVIVSSLLGIVLIDRLPLLVTGIVVMFFSFVALIPIFRLQKIKEEKSEGSIFNVKIERSKVLFSIFEQFKVMFLEIQPLFLYLYVKQSVYYVGFFNVIVNVASLIVLYFLSRRICKNYFKYFCLGLGIVFLFKLNIKSGIILLFLAFLEGILVKIYENVSLNNLYDFKNQSLKNYLILEEFIFFFSKSVFMLVVYLFHFSIYMVMYLCMIGIMISGFFIHESERK